MAADPADLEHWLHAPAPEIDAGQARQLAAERYGINASPHALLAERDRNFRLDVDGRPAFVLKIHTADADPAALQFRLRALDHLARREPGLPVPRVRRGLSGTSTVEWTSDSGTRHLVTLLSWIDGRPADFRTAARAVRFATGQLLARMSLALADCSTEGAPCDLPWDPFNTPSLREFLPAVSDPALRALVSDQLDRFGHELQPALAARPAQAIHNDLNPDNVLLAGAGPEQVAGFIDFGDMVAAPSICEVAVAGAYHLGPGPDPLPNLAGLLAGCQSVRPVPPEDAGLLLGLLASRLAASVLIQAFRAAAHPDNRAYFEASPAMAAVRLRWLRDLDPEEATDRIRQLLEVEEPSQKP